MMMIICMLTHLRVVGYGAEGVGLACLVKEEGSMSDDNAIE